MFHLDIDFSFSIVNVLSFLGLIAPIIAPFITEIIVYKKKKDVSPLTKDEKRLSVPDIPSFAKKKK